MATERVEHTIERVCNQGCRAVWQAIERLQRGERVAETDDLSLAEIQAVLAELKTIMAVYSASETCSLSR